MKYVQRRNEVLRIADDQVDAYLKDGYDLLDDEGKTIKKKGQKATYTAQEYKALEEVNAKLKAENAKLKAELKK